MPQLTRRDAYVLIVAVAVVGLAHASLTRYEWRPTAQLRSGMLRIDRWTGRIQVGAIRPDWGRWVSTEELQRDGAKKAALIVISTHSRPDTRLPLSAAPTTRAKVWDELDQALAEIDKAIGPEVPPKR